LLDVTIITPPLYGNMTQSPDAFHYVPDRDFFGVDTLVYETQDQNASTAPVTLMIQVAPVNDPPVIEILGQYAANVTDKSFAIPVDFSDVDNDEISVFDYASMKNPLAEILVFPRSWG